MDIPSIVSAGLPVLCIDTCSLLDIMRDPTRDTVKPDDRQAAIELVTIAESGGLACLIADQVSIEFAEHDRPVQEEAKQNLLKVRQQIERINKLSAVYGAPGALSLRHLDDHVTRARAVVERWLARLENVKPSAGMPAKAFARVNAGLAPAARGKESSKDCLVYETYLEAVTALRSGGLLKPIVYLSSNTKEYLTESKVLKPDIVKDFGTLNLQYA